MADLAHAEHLDGIYRHQRFIYDLTREYYLLGRDRLISELAPPAGGSVLEVGCGTARNLIEAARRFPSARLFGVDLSSMMLRSAAASVGRRGLGERIALQYGDATSFDATALFGRPAFDRVFMSYTLSMMPGWEGAVRHGLGLLPPGGSLHVVDFGRCERLPAAFKRTLEAWLVQFSVHPRADLVPELNRLAHASGCTVEASPLFRGYATYAVLRRPAARG